MQTDFTIPRLPFRGHLRVDQIIVALQTHGFDAAVEVVILWTGDP